MIRFLTLAVGTSLALASAAAAQSDDFKANPRIGRDRIDYLERELAKATRDLQELRAKIGDDRPAPKTSELIQALNRAYEKLSAEALDKEHLLKATKSFENGDALGGLSLLRRGRHPSAIPLILKDMVERESRPKFKKDDVVLHVRALAILSGDDVETAFAKVGSGHRLAQDWWTPRRETLNTDIGKMTPAQLAHVARTLRECAEYIDAYKSNGPSYYANALLYKIANHREDSPDRRGPQGWSPEELHPALGPVFLASMGYRPEGSGGQEIVDVSFRLVHILASMRKNSDLPLLDKVAEDGTQSAGLRLVCLVSLHSAGEGVRVPAVASILAREKNLDRKLAALEFRYYADAMEPAADYLLEAIDDPNVEVRRSVVNALRKGPPPRMLKKLMASADAKHQALALEVIAAMRTVEAQAYLAGYLAKTMQDQPKTDRIHDALWAFQHATNQSWISAGRYPFDHYLGQATNALAWWKEQGGRQ
jgi:hypothetical protein